MKRILALVAVALVVAGCGEAPSQQAEEVGSLAAEGALLAHDASESRGTTKPYTRVHADELASAARRLAASAPPRAAEIAREVARALEQLADGAGDQDLARRLERRLRRAADEAERLAERS